MVFNHIICKNDLDVILNKMQEYIDNGSMIKSLFLVSKTEEQVVILVSEKKISKEVAEIWWSGYVAAIGA